MKYRATALGGDTELSVEREGLRIGSRFLDYAEILALRPINHRVQIDTQSDGRLEISMLGFSFDGFWQELEESYGKRSLEALFVDETPIMQCEGEYALPDEIGRGLIALYPDAVCILPPTCHALRIPLCYVQELVLDGYQLSLRMRSGLCFRVGKMGYDTKPFAERAQRQALLVKQQRKTALVQLPITEPFEVKGLFRTKQPDQYWNAAFGSGVCALELFTGEDTATYLYRFSEPKDLFLGKLEEAMEALGVHREIIYLTDRQIAEKPLYRMAVDRSESVRFLRAHSDGRLIHSASHTQKLCEYLQA